MILRRMEWRLPDPLIGNRWLQKRVILYAPYFFIGSFFYINRDAFNKMHVSYATNLILFIGGFFIVVLGFDAGNEYVNEFVHAIFGIVVSGLLFGVFNLFFDKPSSVSYHISDSSYTVYVLHQPLIVILGYYVLKMPVHYVFQFIVILIMGWLMPYLFHKYFVRKFGLIGLLLNGKDYK
jgi:peptidoglycan/LPS O-acetylase OafA/YrhL